jgi:hypothetical protein
MRKYVQGLGTDILVWSVPIVWVYDQKKMFQTLALLIFSRKIGVLNLMGRLV